MNALEIVEISCPYCGEALEIEVDCSIKQQEYIEDCEVCCRPIQIIINIDDEFNMQVDARSESE